MNIDFSTINAYLALIAVVINFTFALLAIVRTSRETVYITFALVCIGVAWWNFWDLMVFATGNPVWNPVGIGAGTPWKNNVSIGSTLAVAAMFHFTLAVVDKVPRNRKFIVLAYMLALPLGILPSFSSYSETVNRFWVGPWWNLSFFILLFPFMLASIIMIGAALSHSKGTLEAGWLKYIFIAMILQVGTGMTDLFHKMNLALPPLGHLGSVVGPAIFAVGVYRHREAFDILPQYRKKLEAFRETAAQIAHEVKNPLTAIKGVAKLQADPEIVQDSDKIRLYEEILEEEFLRIETILNSLQDITRPVEPDKELINVNKVIRKTVELVDFAKPCLDIELQLESQLTKMKADPSLLKQVFLNLIRNASDACGNEGKLWILTEKRKAGVAVRFVDNGPGFSKEILGRALEPFFSTRETGIGLGLAVTERIMEAHGGQVSLQNAPNGGAVVVLRFPY